MGKGVHVCARMCSEAAAMKSVLPQEPLVSDDGGQAAYEGPVELLQQLLRVRQHESHIVVLAFVLDLCSGHRSHTAVI